MTGAREAAVDAGSIEWIVAGLLPDGEALELLTPLAVPVDAAEGPTLEVLIGSEAE